MKIPIEELIEVLKIHRDSAMQKANDDSYADSVREYNEGRGGAFSDAMRFAEIELEKEKEFMQMIHDTAKESGEMDKAAMTFVDRHDKILIKTGEFVHSNRKGGETYAHYHYDMMADFALHILNTFNNEEG